jgi:glycosyltransferase involved in cell wall biosynthesis
MAKIGIDIRNIGKQRTGDEVVFFNLVKNLAKIDQENEYALFTDNTDNNFLEKVAVDLEITEKENFKIIPLGAPGGMNFLKNKFIWNLWILPDYLRHHKVDIYHTQYIVPFFVPERTKIVTTIHDISFKVHPDFIPPTDLFFLNWLIPRALKYSDKIIAVSDFTKNEIASYYPIDSEKIAVVKNGLDEEWKGEGREEFDLPFIREKYRLPEKFILYLGTLQPRKNIPFLLQAFSAAKEKLPDWKLVIAGNRKAYNIDTEIESALQRYKLADEVVFTGYIEEADKKAIYQLSGLVIFPSIYEGFGLPLLEAMSQKVPVLSADIPAYREVAAEGAIYYKQFDLANLKEKLYNACEDEKLRSDAIRLGFARVQFFSWEKSARDLHDIYLSLAAGQKTSGN